MRQCDAVVPWGQQSHETCMQVAQSCIRSLLHASFIHHS